MVWLCQIWRGRRRRLWMRWRNWLSRWVQVNGFVDEDHSYTIEMNWYASILLWAWWGHVVVWTVFCMHVCTLWPMIIRVIAGSQPSLSWQRTLWVQHHDDGDGSVQINGLWSASRLDGCGIDDDDDDRQVRARKTKEGMINGKVTLNSVQMNIQMQICKLGEILGRMLMVYGQ